MAEDSYIGSPDNPRTTAATAYITFIGWIVAYFLLYPGSKTGLSAFHLRQTLLIHIFSFVLKTVYSFNVPPVPAIDIAVVVLSIILFLLWLLGFVDAMNGRERSLPLIGRMARRLFRRI